MVPLSGLEFGEIGRALLAGLVSLAVLLGLRHIAHTTSRLWEAGLLLVAMVVWLGVSALVLRLSGSALPNQLMARFAKRA
jgi:putative peptidoglycan lipid II flippase